MATPNIIDKATFTTPSDRELLATHIVEAPRALVWDAHTDPRHVPHWMLGPAGWTMPACEIDLRPGCGWRFVWRDTEGRDMEMRGVYHEISPPERLVYTENWGGDWPETLCTLELSEADGRTTIKQRVLYPSPEAREKALQTGMTDGWAAALELLSKYLREIG